MMDTIRVVLADDHPFMRKGICSMLNKTEDIEVVGEARDGFEALTLVHDLEPDVLLLDMEMPGLQGMEVAKELEAAGSKVPILALSAYEDKQYILGILATGAAGYLTKDELPETIVRAIRGVAQGESGWVSGKVAEYLSNWQKHQH
jgi:two-component system, NarL family, response regulator DegU